MNVEQYDSFFREYYSYICYMVSRCGIKSQDIKDVSSDIILKIIEQDGLGKFDPDKNVKIITYITSYVLVLARGERSKSLRYSQRNRLVDEFDTINYQLNSSNAFPDSDLYDRIKSMIDGDALTFLEFAADSKDYRLARKNLSDMGWEKRRITAAVKTVRKITTELVDV